MGETINEQIPRLKILPLIYIFATIPFYLMFGLVFFKLYQICFETLNSKTMKRKTS